MRNAQAVGIITDAFGGKKEIDCFICCHCNTNVHVKQGMKPDELGSWCTLCMKMHCAQEACFTCVPFEKQMERQEAAYHARRSYG